MEIVITLHVREEPAPGLYLLGHVRPVFALLAHAAAQAPIRAVFAVAGYRIKRMSRRRIILSTFNISTPPDLTPSLAPKSLKYYALSDADIRAAYDIEILEFSYDEDPEGAALKLVELDPDMIGFSCYMWNSQKIYSMMPNIKAATGATIILGGPEVGHLSEQILKKHPEVDIIARYEGEETFKQLLKYDLLGKGLEGVDGITYRDKSKIIKNKDRRTIDNIDSLPSVHSMCKDPMDGKVVYVEGSRGCRNNCIYCNYASPVHRLRLFSTDRIKDDLSIILKGKPWFIHWTDSVFNMSKGRLKEICSFIIHNNHNDVPSQIFIDPAAIDDQDAELLYRANMK